MAAIIIVGLGLGHSEAITVEASRALPPGEMAKINLNYRQDLEELAELAAEKGKTIIVSSVPSNGDYKPLFSVHRPGMTEGELERFDHAYARGLALYQRSQFREALTYLLEAYDLDQHVAILNYMIGRSYLHLGDVGQGRSFVTRSIDDDGLPFRSLSSLRHISETVARGFDSVYFVDTVASFGRAMDAGISEEQLFSDFQHPSLFYQMLFL